MLLSMGFPPSVLTCGDVEPHTGPRAHSCTIWAVLLTSADIPPPPPPRRIGLRPPPPPLAAGRLRLLECCGDIHPHPGPMRVIVSNVTSVRTHWAAVSGWEADMVILAETRLTLQGQRVMTGLAREAGWQAFWGAPLPSRGGGTWDAPQGGVGLLVRHGVPARAVRPPRKREQDPLHTELWESRRWLHVLVGAGSGDVTVHVQPVYGHSGRPAANAAFFGSVLEYAARHGNAPQLLGGDFNDPLDDLRRLPQSLSMALMTPRLVDVDAELAAATGGERVCRYEGGAGMRPTRIDGLLASTALAPMIRSVTALPETGIPGHMPAVFELGLEAAGQRVARFVKPKKVEVPQRGPEALEELGERLLSPLEAEWTTMQERGDIRRGVEVLDVDGGGGIARPLPPAPGAG